MGRDALTVPIVDAHCHASPVWFEPVEPLIDQMDRYGVDHAVLVQMQGQTDNGYQRECAARYPDRLVSVVWVDAEAPDAPERLQRERDLGARGVRFRATTRSPGPDPLLIWRAAAELELPVSCTGSLAENGSDDFADLVVALPGLPIVVEHLGTSTSRDRGVASLDPFRRVFALARFQNVYLKIHGLSEFAKRAPPGGAFPFHEPIPPLLEMAREAFGPTRMLWGSNYPPVSQQEGYLNALRLPMVRFAEADRAAIFGGTAAALYGLV